MQLREGINNNWLIYSRGIQ